MYNDGYKYWLAYKKNNASYYRCCRYKTNCPGRCVVEDDKVRNTTPHNHSPEPDRVLVDKFRKTLTYRAATESTDLYNIFWDEAIQRHADAAMLYTFAAAESAMRKARRKRLPPMPNTLLELTDILSKSSLFHIHSGQQKDTFYQTTLELNDNTCLIFVHRKTLKVIGRVEEMHLDVTFDIKPSVQCSYSLLTAHSVQSYYSVPFLYAVMAAKTTSGYAAIFAYMRENFPTEIVPNIIICNFEIDMQSTLSLTFPEATIKGFWSHYTTTVLKQMKLLQLQRETHRGHGASFLRMILVLPLLSAEYMIPGLEAVRKWAEEKKIFSKQLIDLCTFVEQQCIRTMGAEKLSIFGLPHCVHNHIQNFNKDLQNSIGGPNPMIWQMLDGLTSTATRTYVKLNKHYKNLVPKKQPKKGQHVIDSIIKNATQLWIRTPVHLRNPLNFLQLTSHCINDTIYYANLSDLRMGDATNDSKSIENQWNNKNSLTSTTTQSVNILGGFTRPSDITYQQQQQQHGMMNGQHKIAKSNCAFRKAIATTGGSVNCADSTSKCNKSTTLKQQSMLQQNMRMQLMNTDATSHEMIDKINVAQKSDPPPLAFFPKIAKQSVKIRIIPKEPPPLVPIGIKK